MQGACDPEEGCVLEEYVDRRRMSEIPVPAPDSDPGFAGVTGFRTYYEVIKVNIFKIQMQKHPSEIG